MNQKPDRILKLIDDNVYNLREKSKKEELIEKFNELIQPLKDEGISLNLEKSPSPSHE